MHISFSQAFFNFCHSVVLKYSLFSVICSGLAQAGELNSVSKVVAPLVVIGSLIVGLLMALLYYRWRVQREYPTDPHRACVPNEQIGFFLSNHTCGKTRIIHKFCFYFLQIRYFLLQKQILTLNNLNIFTSALNIYILCHLCNTVY